VTTVTAAPTSDTPPGFPLLSFSVHCYLSRILIRGHGLPLLPVTSGVPLLRFRAMPLRPSRFMSERGVLWAGALLCIRTLPSPPSCSATEVPYRILHGFNPLWPTLQCVLVWSARFPLCCRHNHHHRQASRKTAVVIVVNVSMLWHHHCHYAHARTHTQIPPTTGSLPQPSPNPPPHTYTCRTEM
jgi:hypothetical protein